MGHPRVPVQRQLILGKAVPMGEVRVTHCSLVMTLGQEGVTLHKP